MIQQGRRAEGREGENASRAAWAWVHVALTGRGEPGCGEGECLSLGTQRDPWQDAERRAQRSNLDLVSLGPSVAEKQCSIKASLGTQAECLIN